ncbi:MAG: hypothetical protein Q8898_15445, partial [Bacillota bacterium]|nr:hypothetical protein [Bacillota bacterium]
LVVISLLFMFSACSNQNQSAHPPSSSKKNKELKNHFAHFIVVQWKLPIKVPEGEFFKICCWENSSQIIYISNVDKSSNVYRYDFLTGESKLLYKSRYPVVTVKKSPSGKHLLIQSSPSSYEGTITVIDNEGKQIWDHSIPSFELSIEWNPYNESELLISAFKEDWSFKVFQLNLDRNDLSELDEPQPFLKWINKSSVAYLDWKNNDPVLFAPLEENQIGNTKISPVFDKVYQFGAFKDVLFTITVEKEDKTKAVYSFYDKGRKLIYSFKVPQLTQFSDWLVPFYDFNEQKKEFLDFQPLLSTDKDTYNDGFQLVDYDLKKKKRKLLMEGMENLPISCNPSGEACLYGNRFEKLIDLNTQKIHVLVHE